MLVGKALILERGLKQVLMQSVSTYIRLVGKALILERGLKLARTLALDIQLFQSERR